MAPQHAGCTGQVENCVTTVFSAYVTARGQAWADFDVYMPDRWARDMPRRRAAGIPGDLDFATKPQLAIRQLGRLTAAGLPVKWVAFDEVYGRSEELRKKAAKAGLSYVAIIPCDYQVPLPSGAVIRADETVADAVFERRSCGNGKDVLGWDQTQARSWNGICRHTALAALAQLRAAAIRNARSPATSSSPAPGTTPATPWTTAISATLTC